jgi:hypothetical protein
VFFVRVPILFLLLVKTIFLLAQQVAEIDVSVFVNGIRITSGFYIIKESKKHEKRKEGKHAQKPHKHTQQNMKK